MKKLVFSLFLCFIKTLAITQTFNYNHRLGASEILLNFINDTQFTNELFNHGCWCSELDPNDFFKQFTIGGPVTVDELDLICKHWAQARSCNKLDGKSCFDYQGIEIYELEYFTGVQDANCLDSDSCLSETCQIDLFYANEIINWKSLNGQNFEANEETNCGVINTSGDNSFCENLEISRNFYEQCESRQSRIVGGNSITENQDQNPFGTVTDWILHLSMGCKVSKNSSK